MFIRFACRRCRTFLEISVRMAGNPVHCPVCRRELIVPSSSDPLPASWPAATATENPVTAPATAMAPAKPVPAWAGRRRLLVRASLAAAVLAILATADWLISPKAVPSRSVSEPASTVAAGPVPERAAPATRVQDLALAFGEQEDSGSPLRHGALQARLGHSGGSLGLPLNLPDAPNPGQVRRREHTPEDSRSRLRTTEDRLRQELLNVREVSLERQLFNQLVTSYYQGQQQAQLVGYVKRYDPTYLVQTYPGVSTLPLRYGRSCRLDHTAAGHLDKLSRKLRIDLAKYDPIGPDHHRGPPDLLRAHLRQEMHGQNPEWLRAGAIPALMQQLMAEETPIRRLLVELLSEIKDRQASVALANRAAFDLSPEVRSMAIKALQDRPPDDYRWVFLRALRYPWAPPAEHAAAALVQLHDTKAVPMLINLLNKPNPRAPFRVGKRYVVREMVRTNHLANCLLCHPPSVTYRDPVPGVVPAVTWQYPAAGPKEAGKLTSSVNSITGKLTSTGSTIQTGCHNYTATSSTSAVTIRSGQQSVVVTETTTVVRNAAGQVKLVTSPVLKVSREQTGASGATTPGRRQPVLVNLPLLVRGDITYLRQDFSVPQPVPQPGSPVPLDMRFDYMVSVRPVTADEAQQAASQCDNTSYEQRESVLTALRGLTGQDAGDSIAAWRKLVPHSADESKAWALCEAAVRATPQTRHDLLVQLRDGKGLPYTDALARAIAKLPTGARAEARDLLTQRLTRMTGATLQAKLHDEDGEVRRAAAGACARKQAREQVPDIIELLDDPDPGIVQAAHRALQSLSGCDFGPPERASTEQRLQAVSAWRGWSDKLGRN